MSVIVLPRAGDHADIGSLERKDSSALFLPINHYWGRGAVHCNSKKKMNTLNKLSYKYKLSQKRNFEYVSKLKKNVTIAESLFKDFLDKHNIYYKFQKGFLIPFHRIVDFYLPKNKTIIEIDGEIHENLKGDDLKKDYSFLNDRGFKTIRIKNSEVFDGSFKSRLEIVNLLATLPIHRKEDGIYY